MKSLAYALAVSRTCEVEHDTHYVMIELELEPCLGLVQKLSCQ